MEENKKIYNLFEEINNKLKIESEEIKKLDAYSGDFFTLKKYDIKQIGNEYKLTEDIPQKNSAIYIFYSESGVQTIGNTFNNVKYGAKSNDNVKRTKAPYKYIYLGKSFAIKTRIKEHLSSGDSSPYSLKYNHKNRQNVLKETKLYIFELRKDYESYKEIILSTVETNLHKSCQPIIGSKRV